MPDRTTANTSPTGAETVRSHPESIAPLQPDPRRPTHLDLSLATKNNAGTGLPTPGKSPRSFRSSFILPSRGATSGANRPQGQGHEKLSSAASSPTTVRQTVQEAVKKELGKNYEYFTGNTLFMWGGRLQNTRDRPINVLTGLLFLTPNVLFFIFSCVFQPQLWLEATLTDSRFAERHGYGTTFHQRYPLSTPTFV
jgi:palmitoyltransferase ZDHHC9/14/18